MVMNTTQQRSEWVWLDMRLCVFPVRGDVLGNYVCVCVCGV